MKLWVVTVNWNQPVLTLQCIQSLRENNELHFSVVIVDNGSSDKSVEYLNNITSVNLIENQENLGFACGFNIGIKYALSQGADYIFMVNNDTLSTFKMLDILFDSAIKLHADIVGPAIYYSSAPDQIWSAGGKLNTLVSAPVDAHHRKKPLPGNPLKRDFLTGCALLIYKEVFNIIGFFDEGFFLYYEDLDLFMRAKKADLNAWLIPNARLLHHVSGSIPAIKSDNHFYWMGLSSWKYFFKHVKPWQWFFVIPWRIAHAIKKIIQLVFIGKYNAANAYIKGNINFFCGHRNKER